MSSRTPLETRLGVMINCAKIDVCMPSSYGEIKTHTQRGYHASFSKTTRRKYNLSKRIRLNQFVLNNLSKIQLV